MSEYNTIEDIVVDYRPVDTRQEPDFSEARVTGVVLSTEDEVELRVKAGQVIEVGNSLSGYSRKELAELCDIKSAQFSKIVKGEAWLNIGNLGLWGFATGISPTEVAKLAPLTASPSTCVSWYVNGHLNHMFHDEFDSFCRYVAKRMGVKFERVNVIGDEPVPKLKDKAWRESYLDDLGVTVGQRVRQLRETLSLSQKSFADILGVTPDTIKRYESGRVRFNHGIFATYRLYATVNVNPIEITRGSVHHRLRYVQEQRHLALKNMFKQVEYPKYKEIKKLALSVSMM